MLWLPVKTGWGDKDICPDRVRTACCGPITARYECYAFAEMPPIVPPNALGLVVLDSLVYPRDTIAATH